MTVYASQQDMIDRLGQDVLETLAWNSDSGQLDTARVDRALADATDEINARIGKRYTLPLSSVPGLLKRVAVHLAVYHLATGPALSEDIEKRYQANIKLLISIGKGESDLGLPDDALASENSQGAVVIKGPERQLTRDTLKGVL